MLSILNLRNKILFLFLFCTLFGPPAYATSYSSCADDPSLCTIIAYPGAVGTYAYGINNYGDVAGVWEVNGANGSNGFIYSGDSYVTFNYPQATYTTLLGINSNTLGQVIGGWDRVFPDYSTQNGSFLYSGGAYTSIHFPNSITTSAKGINDAAQIVGTYTYADLVNHGFLFSYLTGLYTNIDYPGASNTEISAINNSGQFVGIWYNSTHSESFLYTPQTGVFTTISCPGASNTQVTGINDLGDIVGICFTPDLHGFVLSEGTYYSFDYPGASGGVFLTGINASGQIVGTGFFPGGPQSFIYQNSDVTDPPVTGLPPVNTRDSCPIENASTIVIDSLALVETIPLVGVGFNLSYSSDRMSSGFAFQTKAIGLGGWTPSILHHYDVSHQIIYTGDSGLRNIQATKMANGGYSVTDDSGSEIYYFDSSGNHLSTKDSLTGISKFTFSYNSLGQLTSIVDPFSNATTFQFLSGGVKLFSPYGQVTQLTLDGNGYLSSVTNPNSETYRLSSNGSGKLLSLTKPAGQTSLFSYDSSGYLTKDQGAGGNIISLQRSFDSSSLIQTVTAQSALNRTTLYQTSATQTSSQHSQTYPDGSSSNSKSADQLSKSATDSNGDSNSDQLAQDPRFGWMAPYSSLSTYQVPNSNISLTSKTTKSAQLSDSSDPLSLVSLTTQTIIQNDSTRTYTTHYNSSQKSSVQTSPLGRTIAKTLNAQDELSSIQVGPLNPITFNYDARGRLTSSHQADRQTSFSYDANGNLSSQTDPLGRLTRYQYDRAGRMINQELPDGNAIASTYDANGNLTSITPPGKTAHSFSYNLFELTQSYLPPALSSKISGATTYSYNLDRQMTQINRPDGSQIEMNYLDGSGLLNSVSAGSAVYSFNYLPKSSLISSAVSPDSEISTYQYVGQIKTSEKNSGPVQSLISYGFNTDASLASRTVNASNTLHFAYDKDSLLISAGPIAYVRNLVGSVSSSIIGRISESKSYDSFGELTSNQWRSGQIAFLNEKISRDKLGRILGLSTSGIENKARIYDYDNTGRLSQVSDGRRILSTYRYDSNSNRIEKLTPFEHIRASYDQQDRLIQYGNRSYEYDANGELSEMLIDKGFRKEITKYSFDDFGNLKTVLLPDNKRIDYILDASNRRVGKKINGRLVQAFIYQSQTQIAAELDGNGNILREFIYGEKSNIPDAMIMNGKNYRIISDQVGTPNLVIDTSTGKVVKYFSLDEFGDSLRAEEELSVENCEEHRDENLTLPFGFAGGIYDDDTGLLHFGARDYDPYTGRWTSKDPILFNGQQTNLYSYTFNDPVNFIDPTGLIFQNFIAQHTTAIQQAAIASAGIALSGFLINAAILPTGLNIPLLALGAGIGLEAGVNLTYVKQNRLNELPNIFDLGQQNQLNQNQCNMGN